MLHRVISDRLGHRIDYQANLGVVQFNLLYFKLERDQSVGAVDTLRTVVAGDTSQEAKLIEVDLKVEPTAAYDTAYRSNYAFWRQIRLTSMNMINR